MIPLSIYFSGSIKKYTLLLQAIGRSGSYTDLTKTKSTCELKDLRRENELLKVKYKVKAKKFQTLI